MERINFQNNAKIYITAMKLYLTIKVEIILYTQWNETISVMQLIWKEVSKKEQLLLLLCHTHTPDVQTTHVLLPYIISNLACHIFLKYDIISNRPWHTIAQ